MLNELAIARKRFQLEHSVNRSRREYKLALDATTRLLSNVYIDYFSIYCKGSVPIINWEKTFKRLRDVDFEVDLLERIHDKTFATIALCIGSYISDNRHYTPIKTFISPKNYESIEFHELFIKALEYTKASFAKPSSSTASIMFILHEVMSLIGKKLTYRNKNLKWWDDNLEKMYLMKHREISGNVKKNGIKSIEEFLVYFALASVIPVRPIGFITPSEIDLFHNHLCPKIPKEYECLKGVLETILFLRDIRSYNIGYFARTKLESQDMHQVIEPYFANLDELDNRIKTLQQEIRQSKIHDSIKNYAQIVFYIIKKEHTDLTSRPSRYVEKEFEISNTVSLAAQPYLWNLKNELASRSIHALLSYCEYCRSSGLLFAQQGYLILSMGASLGYLYYVTRAIWTPSYENGGPPEYTTDRKVQTCKDLFLLLEKLQDIQYNSTIWLDQLKYLIYSINSIYPQSYDANNAANAISIILQRAINIFSEIENEMEARAIAGSYLHVTVKKVYYLKLMLNDIANYFVEHFSQMGLENLLEEEVVEEFETFWTMISLFQQNVSDFEINTGDIVYEHFYTDVYVTSYAAILLCIGRLSRWISIICQEKNGNAPKAWLLELQRIYVEHVLSAMLEYVKNSSPSINQQETFILASGDFEYLAQIAIDTPIAEKEGPSMYTRDAKLTLCKGLIPIVTEMTMTSSWYKVWLERIHSQINELELQNIMIIAPFSVSGTSEPWDGSFSFPSF